MSDEPLISIRGRGDDRLVLRVREHHPGHLEVTVEISAGAMRAAYPARLSPTDLAEFRTELQTMLAGEDVVARFAPTPEFLEFAVTDWPDGLLTCRGTAVDGANMLAFDLALDRSTLRAVGDALATMPI